MIQVWVLLALASALTFAFRDVIAKKYFTKGLDVQAMLLEQNILQALLFGLLFVPLMDVSKVVELWYLLVLKAFVLFAVDAIYFYLLKTHDISQVSPLLNLSPMILIVLSALTLGEVISLLQFIGIVIMIIATYFLEVTVKHHSHEKPHSWHFKKIFRKPGAFFMWAFALLVLISIAGILDRSLGLHGMDVYTNLCFTGLAMSVFIFMYAMYRRKGLVLFPYMVKHKEIIGLSVLSIASTYFVVSALTYPTALVGLVVPLRRTGTIFGALIGGLLFHEKHLKKKMIAASAMFIGLLCIVV